MSTQSLLTSIEATIALVVADPDDSVDAYGIARKQKRLKDLFDTRDRLRSELSRQNRRRFALSDRRADT